MKQQGRITVLPIHLTIAVNAVIISFHRYQSRLGIGNAHGQIIICFEAKVGHKFDLPIGRILN